MKCKILLVIIAFSFIVGCTFNIKEQSKEVTVTSSTVGLTEVSFDKELLEDNDISVQGIEGKSITITTHARMLMLNDSDDDLDDLQLIINQNGKITRLQNTR